MLIYIFFTTIEFAIILKVDKIERSLSMAFISLLMISLMYLGIILILAIIETVGKWQVYKKMGIFPWKCLIPYYNNYVEYSAVWRKEFFFTWLVLTIAELILPGIYEDIGMLLRLIVIVITISKMVVTFLFCTKMTKAFDKGIGYSLGLFLLPFVFYPILGFSKDISYVHNNSGP